VIRVTGATDERAKEAGNTRTRQGRNAPGAPTGTVYLLHFEQRLGRCRHYLGYTTNLVQRLEDHRLGRGGKTTARFRAAGIGFELAAQWPGSPDDERRLKAKNLPSICPICREETMTVLEALQQAADPGSTRATVSLTDLVNLTKLSRSRVRAEISDLLDDRKITIVSKGDAGQNKTVYQLALCVPVRPAVRENYAQHSSAQLNRTLEQDTNSPADSIALDTVPGHSAARTVSNSSTGQGDPPEPVKAGSGTPRLVAPPQLDPTTTALPPLLSYFKDVHNMGCCLDVSCHYIVHVTSVMNALRYTSWAPKNYASGMLSIFHIPHRDSRLNDIFHGVCYFRDGLRHDEASKCECVDHRLMRLVKTAFPAAIETQVRVRNCFHEFVEALYDVRRFCPECVGLPVLPARFAGFDYNPYELTAGGAITSSQKAVPESKVDGCERSKEKIDAPSTNVITQ